MRKEIYRDHPTINWVLDHCKILHLGLTNCEIAYVVPVNYGYEELANGNYIIYVHGTTDGKKGEILNQEPVISFQTDSGHEHLTYTPPSTGAFGPAFRSIMGIGQVTSVTDNTEKVHAMRTILHNYVRDIPVTIKPEKLANVSVWKIEVAKITARIHHPTKEWQQALGLDLPILEGIHYDDDGGIISVDDVDGVSGASENE